MLGRIGGPLDPRGIRLIGARITGQLNLTDAHSAVPLVLQQCRFDMPVVLDRAHLSVLSLRGSVLPSLSADGLCLRHDLGLDQVTVSGRDGKSVWLLGAHIGGYLDLVGAKLTNDFGPALAADGIQVDGSAHLEGLRATGYGRNGTVRLPGARIGRQLEVASAQLTNDFGPALIATGVQVGGNVVLSKLRAAGRGEDGAVQLESAHVTGHLDLGEVKLTNRLGPALSADGLQVDQGAYLAHVIATGRGEDGAVRLLGAHIGTQLQLFDAELTNKTGPALIADGLQVGSDLVMPILRAVGIGGALGAVRLLSAHIGGQLNLAGVELTNNSGPALIADGLRVDGLANLDLLRVTGCGKDGVVRLLDAHIGGELAVSGQVTATGAERVILDLQNAQVGGEPRLWDTTFWKAAFGSPEAERPRVMLNGFIYRSQPKEPDAGTWLQVLRQCMPTYVPQPYRQLAEVCRAEGDEQRAKTTLIAQEDARGEVLRHGHAHWRGPWVWHSITRMTVRYGYQSARALRFLLVVLAISCSLMIVADTRGLLVHPKTEGAGRCGVVETIGSAVDGTVPLLGFAAANRCELTNAGAAQWIFVFSLVLQVLSWAFITLFVTGFTGIVRKPSA
jgi:hypothetical protein